MQQQYPSDDCPERRSFARQAKRAFELREIPVRGLKTWVSIQKPCCDGGYADEYPHVHYPLDGVTLVHYLEPGDKPAPLHIFEGDEVVEEIVPERGLTVFMPNALKHGVVNNHGTTDRIQLIATALPR